MHLGLLTQRPGHLSVCHSSVAGCMHRHASAYEPAQLHVYTHETYNPYVKFVSISIIIILGLHFGHVSTTLGLIWRHFAAQSDLKNLGSTVLPCGF